MRDRIELNRNLPSTAISGRVMHEFCSHALDTVPEECCGLIRGTEEDPFQAVYRITNVMTKKHLSDAVAFPRDACHAYYMSEAEYLRAQKDAEGRGASITAVYHSHVGNGAYLSQEDRAYAEHPLFPFPGAAQIVIAVLGGRVDSAAIFLQDAETSGFGEGSLLEVSGA